MNPTTPLRLENLQFFDYGPYTLRIAPGECVGLSGPSGSGKTRLLRAISDLDPHQGNVYLGDTESRDFPAPRWRRLVAMLPAESRWWHDRVGEHFTAVNGDWLGRLGFDEKIMDFPVSRLSTGERQRLALVRMIANEPRALLLDEPTASLDAENSRRVETLITDYRRRKRAAILWVSHDPAQLTRVANRRFLMEAGQLSPEKKKF